MYDVILETIQKNAVELITLGGKVHPYAAIGVALLLVVSIIGIFILKKKDDWRRTRRDDARTISDETGRNQDSNRTVEEDIDDFLK